MECNNYAPFSYYSVLGIGPNSSDEDIKHAYRKLAMQWHPDKWTRLPSQIGEAKKKFQQIQEAYSVLSDKRNRMMYDAGLYNSSCDEDDEVEGFADFVQEMVSLMEDARKEERSYSIKELQSMFWDMAQSFQATTNEWDNNINDYDHHESSSHDWFYGESFKVNDHRNGKWM